MDKYYEIKELEGRGRGAIATKDITAGTIILRDSPLFFVPEYKFKEFACPRCGKATASFEEIHKYWCSGCFAAHYCSHDCREKDEKDHGFECDLLANISDRIVETESLREITRSVIRLLSILNANPGKIERYEQLISNSDKFNDTQNAQVSLIAEYVSQLVKQQHDNDIPTDKICDYIKRNGCNMFAYAPLHTKVGRVLYVDGSFFNHSCSPNVCIAKDANCPLIHINIATRDIKAGEELVISYIGDLRKPREERQKSLKHTYFFDCKCSRCSADEDTLPSIICPKCGTYKIKENEKKDTCPDCVTRP